MEVAKEERLCKSNCREANLGSHLSFDEAAARLGCSKRTVHNHVKRGYLTKSFQNGKVVLRREEVEQLAVSTGVDLPAINKQSIFMLMTKVQRLEEIVGVLQRALDVRDSPLRPSKEHSLQLHGAVIGALAANHWTDEEMEKWSTLFDRFDEVTLDLMSEHLASTAVFEPFFKLCLAQMRNLSVRREFDSDLDLQLLHKKLDAGRKKMRDTVLMWLNLRKGTIPEAVLAKMESDKGVLFQRLAPSQKGSRAKGRPSLG